MFNSLGLGLVPVHDIVFHIGAPKSAGNIWALTGAGMYGHGVYMGILMDTLCK